MYFKKLQMVGFKSFLNKTTCKFEPGVTAIVGPNGCGKSNIVDSIKWVFGEQSPKSMRSSSMQDVIFNGTEKQEAVNVAEVSITLSNEDKILPVDYDEVTITRRLFRSGESEYLINKTQVRLMDVRSLLMGTGLGTSAYSVIEQGKMDMILSSKPEERRYVFEEASGITRYRSQKREAVLKLERTQENLTRLNDIIREVERQIKAIERQARKADRYKAYFEELKALDLRLSSKKYKDLGSDNSSVETETRSRQEVSDKLKQEIEAVSEEILRDRAEYNKLMEDLQEAHSEVVRVTSDIDKNTHMANINVERGGELEKYVQRLDWEIEEAIGKKVAMEKRIESMEVRYKEICRKRKAVEIEIAEIEEEINNVNQSLQTHQHDLQLSKGKTLDIATEQTNHRNILIKLKADIQNAYARENRLLAENKNREREIEVHAERLKETEEMVAVARQGLESKRSEFETIRNEILAKQKELNSLREGKFSKEREIHQISPRIDFLEKLISEREGMKNSVKEVMGLIEAKRADFPGIHGVLSELITVKEGFDESLESLLGDFSQAIVVDTRSDVERLGGALEERSLDSVNFIILDEVTGLDAGGQIYGHGTDAIKNIGEIITVKDPLYGGISGFLDKVFVSKSVDDAKRVVQDESFTGYVLCEKGEVFQRTRHRSRNYSDKEVYSLFGRQKKLEEMKERRTNIERELEKMDSEISINENWLDSNVSKKTEMEGDLNKMQIEFVDLCSKRETVKEKMKVLFDEVSVISVELSEVSSSIIQMKKESEDAEIRLGELERENNEIENKIRMFGESINEMTEDREKAFQRVSNAKADLSGIKKEEEHVAENLSREKDSIQNISKDVEDKKIHIEESATKIRVLKEDSNMLAEKNKELSLLKEQKIFEGAEKKGQKDRLAGQLSVKEKELQEREEKLEAIRDEARDLDIRKKELEYKKEAIAQKVFDHYKVDIRTVAFNEDEPFNPEEAEEMVGQLREKIEKMGEVSLGAAEEHKELEERFAFLTKQRDDLVSSREDIMKAITKINRTTRKLFMETFETVKIEFAHYFKVLFNGGKAELVLEDVTNVLECGIDIVVRPPGKKLQNIMLLSGGEKAMTAIALIFALFKVNPSPFCILDEIDAPLDETNVVRFSTILKEFLKTSQFIIITHNRMTIQLADVLYGITMEEKGVSKVVSVKFSDEEKLDELQQVPAGAPA